MTQEHPITPPPELLRQWRTDAQEVLPSDSYFYIATQAAR
jgi:hypothetical protein